MPGTTAEQSALDLLTEVGRRWTDALAAELAEHGVSLDQWRVLECLDGDDGRPMNEISTGTLIPPPTLTKVVDRLVAANLVHRHNDPLDRRRVLILLTPRGRAMRQRLARLVRAHDRRLDDALGADGTARLTELLHRLRSVPG